MIQFQEYLQSDYPGFASFIDTIIKPIFGDNFKPDKDLGDMIEYPDELEDFDIIENSHDENLKELAEESGLERILKLGTILVQGETRPIYVYDITVSKRRQLTRNRKGIQQLITRTLNNQSGAFMLFHYGDAKWEWRFSYKFVGKDKEDTTNSKRFTYLFGHNQVCKTAAQRFTNLLNMKGKIAFDDITEAFSVEALSKEFFTNYKWHYERFCQFIYDNKNNRNYFGEEFSQWKDKIFRDYVKKLLGRIVFLHFLQKKGWLGVPTDKQWGDGNPKFMKDLYDTSTKEQKANYLDDVIEPLFEDLNTQRADDIAGNWSQSYINAEDIASIKIPYLNGGLFERDTMDAPKSTFPTEYFDDLFEFFNQYNFTIDENDPNDSEVGIDPEMLGRIFENLLEDNKDKGAFYTPKEIVQYMCRESLIAYLQTDIEEESKNSFRQFVVTHDVNELRPADVFLVDKKLREVKICDPAIGSGAFPMGLLKELFDCRMAIEGKENGKTSVEIKKDIIQNSIYGVDIEKGAVDIARLRFWLSLVIDEQTPKALPNMDFKIMQGNSLLEQFNGFDLSTIMSSKKKVEGPVQMTFFEDSVDVLRHQVIALRREYFRETDKSEKKKLRQRMREIVQQQIDVLSYEIDLSKIDIADNSEFFLWHTWFSDVFENGGFDIVIGNPPYLRLQGMKEANPKQAELYSEKFNSATGSFDLYVCFTELALGIINKKGLVNFIMPIKWSNASFGKGLRGVVTSKNAASKIINFGAYQVFNASTYTALQWFKPNQKALLYTELDRDLTTNTELGLYLDSLVEDSMSSISNSKLSKDTWTLTTGGINKLLAKLDKNPRRVSDLFDKIFQGLATGKDDIYFLKDCVIQGSYIKGYSKMLDEVVSLELELCHPLLKGEDVHKYVDISTQRYVVLPYNQSAELLSENILSSDYPQCYNYFKRCEPILRSRERGRFDIDGAWFQLSRKQGLASANKQKLVAPDISMGGNFAYDENGVFFQTATIYGYVKKEGTQESYKTLMALLNSKLCWWFIQNTGAVMSGGFYRYKPAYISPFPIPSEEKIALQSNVLESLVNQILSLKKQNPQADITSLEHEIDNIVYELYGLTKDERLIVEPEAITPSE